MHVDEQVAKERACESSSVLLFSALFLKSKERSGVRFCVVFNMIFYNVVLFKKSSDGL